MFHCLDDGALEITCPSLHWILIKDTAYYISDGTTCPPNATNTTDTHCLAPGKVPEVRAGCHQHEHCDDVTIPQRTTSTCTGSTHYVWIQYQCEPCKCYKDHYTDVIMCALRLRSPASRLFTQPFIQGADQRKRQSPASLAFVRGIHRGPMNSPHKWPITRKIFPFDDVIMRFSKYGDSHFIKIRRSWDRLIIIMRIPILLRLYIYIGSITMTSGVSQITDN